MGLPCQRAMGWNSAVIFPVPASLCQKTSAAPGQHLNLSCGEPGGREVFGTVGLSPICLSKGRVGSGELHWRCTWAGEGLSLCRWLFPLCWKKSELSWIFGVLQAHLYDHCELSLGGVHQLSAN